MSGAVLEAPSPPEHAPASAAASFTCPICRRVSDAPNDVAERRCAVHGPVDIVLDDPALRQEFMRHRDLSHLCRPPVSGPIEWHRVETFDGRCRLNFLWLAHLEKWGWHGRLYSPAEMVATGFRYGGRRP